MRIVVEQAAVSNAVDDAQDRWPGAQEAWEALIWVISRDPESGAPLTESGQTRSLTFHGVSRAGLPSITAVYEIRSEEIIVQAVAFKDAEHGSTGRA